MSELYETLLEEECQPVDYDELLPIVGLGEQSIESPALLDAGVTVSELQSRRVARGKILDAGFTFINRYGDGEKPLLGLQIPPSDTTESAFEPAARVLLTSDEIERIKSYQQAEKSKKGVAGIDPETAREQMLDFLLASMVEYGKEGSKKSDIFKRAQASIIESGDDSHILPLAKLMIREQEKQQQTGLNDLGFIMEQCVAGIDLLKVSGVPIAMMPSRFAVLSGQPSPFIDSGFHFDTNPDVTIYPHDPAKTRRLNMMNVHLLSRGLNEMGDSSNGSHDQTYVTDYEFLAMTDPCNDTREHCDEVALVASRLLAQAASLD